MNKSEIAAKYAREIGSVLLMKYGWQAPGAANWANCDPADAEIAQIVERAIAESQAWISVEEKLPPTGELLIARIAYRSLGHPTEETIVCMVDGEGGGDLVSELGDDIGWTDEVITHWRLADSPPKGNENV